MKNFYKNNLLIGLFYILLASAVFVMSSCGNDSPPTKMPYVDKQIEQHPPEGSPDPSVRPEADKKEVKIYLVGGGFETYSIAQDQYSESSEWIVIYNLGDGKYIEYPTHNVLKIIKPEGW
jgi:hypothetical protein